MLDITAVSKEATSATIAYGETLKLPRQFSTQMTESAAQQEKNIFVKKLCDT